MEDFSFELPPGGIVGVIGANGMGKTTLFRIITGELNPDSGMVEIGETATLSYVDQNRDNLDPGKTVWEEVSGGNDMIELGDAEVNSRAYCSSFNFREPTSRSGPECCPAASATAFTSPNCSSPAEMCCFLTNPPTTLMSKRCGRLRTHWRNSPGVQ